MLKTAAAALVLAVLPVQSPQTTRIEVRCDDNGMCLVKKSDLQMMIQTNQELAKMFKHCGSST